jgi:hypothetical protein
MYQVLVKVECSIGYFRARISAYTLNYRILSFQTETLL